LLVRGCFCWCIRMLLDCTEHLPCWLVESLRDEHTLLEALYEATQDDRVPSRAVLAARSPRSPEL